MRKLILITLSLYYSTLTYGQSIPVTGDQYHLYGPNSTWGEYLKVGGNGRGTTNASVVSTNGNLHLDSKNGNALYLNHYSLGNTYINPQGGFVGIGTASPSGKLHVFNNGNQNGLTIENSSASMTNYGLTVNNTSTTNGYLLRLRSSGVDKVTVTGTGNIGIGTTSPSEKLEVNGLIKVPQATNQDNNSPGIVLISNDDFLYDGKYLNQYGFGFHDFEGPINPSTQRPNPYVSGYYGVDFFTGGQNRLRIHYNGNVGIGTTDTKGFKLGVQGKIAAEEVKVAVYANWADFVFNKDYNLPTLKDVEQHIKDKGHLKDIPSAEAVKKNGIFLGEMDAKLLQKIEELTLYTIDQEKRIKNLESKNEKLIALVEKLVTMANEK